MNYSNFIIFGSTHILMLFITIVLIFFILFLSKYYFSLLPFIGKFIIFIIIISIFVKILYTNYFYKLTIPMHLCDWAAIAVIITYFTKNNITFELAYFWGLSGTLQALLTPGIKYNFPHISFFTFFLMHIGIILGVFYFIFIWKMYPEKGAVKRIFLISQLYLIIAMLFNYYLNKNYGYLAQKPSTTSLLDYFGPWPFYIIGIEIFGIFIIIFLNLFFSKKRIKFTDIG